jgi:hypothetical protein
VTESQRSVILISFQCKVRKPISFGISVVNNVSAHSLCLLEGQCPGLEISSFKIIVVSMGTCSFIIITVCVSVYSISGYTKVVESRRLSGVLV